MSTLVKRIRASSLNNGLKAWSEFRRRGGVVGSLCLDQWEILAANETRRGTKFLVVRPRSLMYQLSERAKGYGCWISRPSSQILSNLEWEQLPVPQDWRDEPKRFEV